MKRKNPSYQFQIQNLKQLGPKALSEHIGYLVFQINSWTGGYYMSHNQISKWDLDIWLSIKKGMEPYLLKENKKIYRSIMGLDIKESGYYCNLDIENSIVQTAIKPLQNWSYSKNFTKKWGTPITYNNIKYIKLIFQSTTKKLYENIIFDPSTIIKYFSKIRILFPEEYEKNEKNIRHLLSYLNSEVQELLLYSSTGDLFVEKMEVYGC